jgi:predicted hydrocarbon binding protein
VTDDGVGRLLVVSLHQSIGETLPQRLEYYEHWLSPMGLRDGRGGLAPLGAVLSFLRQEGEPAYTRVMLLAGRYSADWHHAEDGVTRRLMPWVPRWLRKRLALGRVRRLLEAAFEPVEVKVSTRRGVGTVKIARSVFCTLRDSWAWPTCAYHAGAVQRSLALHGVEAEVQIAACAAQGARRCELTVNFRRRAAEVQAT